MKAYKYEAFWREMWNTLKAHAIGLTGVEVLEAFQRISDQVYDVGIDTAYERALVVDPETQSVHFDLCWIVPFAIELKRKSVEKQAGDKAPSGV